MSISQQNKSNNIKKYYKNKSRIQKITKNISDKYYLDNFKNQSITKCNIRRKTNLRNSCLFGKIYDNITTRISNTLKENNLMSRIDYDKIIGLTFNELEEYIISKLKTNMIFENYGEWEIDHILPISHFNFAIPCNIDKCFHYTNLQPLWMLENRKKSNKIEKI